MQVWDLQIFTFLFNHFYILFTRGFEMCIFKIQKRHIQAKLEAKLPFYIYNLADFRKHGLNIENTQFHPNLRK